MIRGESPAFGLLYQRYQPVLHAFAFRFLNDHTQAEDVIQDVFMKLAEKPEQFDLQRKFSSWIFTITANRCKNQLRERKQFSGYHQHERNFSPGTIRSEQAADRPLLQKKLQQVYESLSEKEKTLFQLRFEKKLGLQQIANQMNMPLGSVKSGLYNLQKKYHPLIQHFSYEN